MQVNDKFAMRIFYFNLVPILTSFAHYTYDMVIELKSTCPFEKHQRRQYVICCQTQEAIFNDMCGQHADKITTIDGKKH